MSHVETAPIHFEPLRTAAERVLSAAFKTAVGVTRAELLTDPERRNRVWRCALDAGGAAPATVIIKQVAAEHYEPDNLASADTRRFFGDWAGAQFLSELDGERHAPAFYGGDRPAGFIALEDFGEHRSLVQPLLEGDTADATRALVAYADRLGRMHAAAYGRRAAFEAIQSALHPELAQHAGADAAQVRQEADTRIDQLNAALSAHDLGIQFGAAARQNAVDLCLAVWLPGEFQTFIHSDPCPDNVFYDGATLRLIDFEFARFGHALRDGLYGRLPFPTCWCSNRVIADTNRRMEDAYREAFGRACPAVLDEHRFQAEAGTVTAFWALLALDMLAEALKDDFTWGLAGIRSRVLTRLGTFVDGGPVQRWAPFQETCGRIRSKLAALWPDVEPMPVYPAFRR